jgi:hypothetical protein
VLPGWCARRAISRADVLYRVGDDAEQEFLCASARCLERSASPAEQKQVSLRNDFVNHIRRQVWAESAYKSSNNGRGDPAEFHGRILIMADEPG